MPGFSMVVPTVLDLLGLYPYLGIDLTGNLDGFAATMELSVCDLVYNTIRVERINNVPKYGKRDIEIIKILLNYEDWVSYNDISSLLNVTDRTIRNDMRYLLQVLQNEGIDIIAERGRGFYVSGAVKEKLRDYLNRVSNADESDDSSFLMLKMILYLLHDQSSIQIDELAEINFVSKTTTEKLLRSITRIINSFSENLHIQRDKGFIAISGSERDKRSLLNAIINEYSIEKLISGSSPFYDKDDYEYIKTIVMEELSNSNLALSELGIVSVTQHCLIALNRCQEGCSLTQKAGTVSEEEFKTVEWKTASNIYKRLSTKYGVVFSEEEIKSLSITTSLRKLIPTEGMSKSQVILSFDEKYVVVVNEILHKLKEEFSIDLTKDDELFIGLIYHIKTLMSRIHLSENYFNPILQVFKLEYPFIFEIAIFIRQVIQDLIGISLNENEVSYIAVHIGAGFQRLDKISFTDKTRVAIVCDANYTVSKFMATKIKTNFSDYLSIIGIYSSYEFRTVEVSDYDLIITSSAKIKSQEKKVIYVNDVLTADDVKSITRIVKRFSRSKYVDIADFFNEAFFLPNLEFEQDIDYIGLIEYLATYMYEKNAVYNSFKKSCLEREKLSSTVLTNKIALPHALEPLAIHSKILFASLRKPINNNGNQVQIVFMIATRKEDQKEILERFFEFVVDLIESAKLVNKLSQLNSFEEFQLFLQECNI